MNQHEYFSTNSGIPQIRFPVLASISSRWKLTTYSISSSSFNFNFHKSRDEIYQKPECNTRPCVRLGIEIMGLDGLDEIWTLDLLLQRKGLAAKRRHRIDELKKVYLCLLLASSSSRLSCIDLTSP